jgi:hypothetical protein
MNAEFPRAATEQAGVRGEVSRPDLSNATVREDLARTGRCAMVHLPTGRTCLRPLRHQGPCDFHGPEDAETAATTGHNQGPAAQQPAAPGNA